MEKILGNFGFGFMRLPVKDGEIDHKQICMMADEFMDSGFNYFDTAHCYHDGKSETAIRKCVTERYDREKFVLTDKLTGMYFDKKEDILPYFETMLKECGTDYFDFFLMHAQTASVFEKYKKCEAYETAFRLKEQGRVRHVGISFHDTADVLDKILTEYPDIEIVQIQLNYLDYDDTAVQSGKCYDVCRKHGKPVIVMEPVKGGSLVNLPEPAAKVLDGLNGGSRASYAIRYAAGFDGVKMVLSGMSNIEQMRDNLSFMKDFSPLNETEREAVKKVRSIIRSKNLVPCTACSYCTEGCPKKIRIPDIFSCLNAKLIHNNWNSDFYYGTCTDGHGKASDCIKCGKCENICPQHLEIRKLLEKAAAEFEH